MGMFGMFDQIGSGIENNPEQFAILMDKLGQGIAPGNAMAGLGTSFGQSSLMNKAKKEQDADKKGFMDRIMSQLGGLTPQGMAGVNNIKTTLDKDGVPETSISFNPPAKSGLGSLSGMVQQQQQQPQPQQPQQRQQINSMFGVSPF